MALAPQTARIRTMLVEDSALFRDLLQIALEGSGQVEIVGAFADGESALAAAPELQPQAAILDIQLAGLMNGVQLGRLLRRKLPGLGIVLLSHHYVDSLLTAVPEEELTGWSYLLKDSTRSADSLLRAVAGSVTGSVMIDPQILQSVRARPSGLLNRISSRQYEILQLMAQGHSNAAIADLLNLARKTVENQINHLYQQLGIDATDPSVQPRVTAVLAYLKDRSLL